MQIVPATYSLEGIGGSETYVVAVADHLLRLGHDVRLHTERPGRGSELAAGLGVRVVASAVGPPAGPDAIVA